MKEQIIQQDQDQQDQDHGVNPVYPQDWNDQYNLLHHLGGVGPYHESTGFRLGTETLHKYEIDEVFILSRQRESFPTVNVGNELLKTCK